MKSIADNRLSHQLAWTHSALVRLVVFHLMIVRYDIEYINMPIRCPYCFSYSVDRLAHKHHLRDAHADLHSRCVSRAIQGSRTEWRESGTTIDTDAVGITFCGISHTIPREVAEHISDLIARFQLKTGPQSPTPMESERSGN